MTKFKFITKEIGDIELTLRKLKERNDTPNVEYMQFIALLEIAHQLRRIADILNTELKNEK